MRRDCLHPRAARTCAAAPLRRPGAAGAAWSAGRAAGARPPAGSCAWPSALRSPPARRRAGLGGRGTRSSCLLSAGYRPDRSVPRALRCLQAAARRRARRPARLLDAQVLARQARAQARLDLTVRAARGLRNQRRLHVARRAPPAAHTCAARRALEPQRVGRRLGAACARAGRRCAAPRVRGLGGPCRASLLLRCGAAGLWSAARARARNCLQDTQNLPVSRSACMHAVRHGRRMLGSGPAIGSGMPAPLPHGPTGLWREAVLGPPWVVAAAHPCISCASAARTTSATALQKYASAGPAPANSSTRAPLAPLPSTTSSLGALVAAAPAAPARGQRRRGSGWACATQRATSCASRRTTSALCASYCRCTATADWWFTAQLRLLRARRR